METLWTTLEKARAVLPQAPVNITPPGSGQVADINAFRHQGLAKPLRQVLQICIGHHIRRRRVPGRELLIFCRAHTLVFHPSAFWGGWMR